MSELEGRFWWFVAKRAILHRMIDRFAPPPQASGERGPRRTAADIGCGCGAMLGELAREFDAVGMDPSPLAREFCAKRGLRVLDGTLPDGLPFAEGSLDVVVMSDVLEHVDRDVESVAAVARTLRPGGIMVCTVPAHPWLWTAHDDHHHHKRRYTRPGYEAIYEPSKGLLKREFLSWYNTGLFPLMVAQRLVMRTRSSPRADAPQTVPPRPVNALFREIFAAERLVMPTVRLPFGASLVSVYRRV